MPPVTPTEIIAAITALVLFLSGVYTVFTNRANAKKTLTFQTLHNTLWDKDFQRFRRQWDSIQHVIARVNSMSELEEYYQSADEEFLLKRLKNHQKHKIHTAQLDLFKDPPTLDQKLRQDILDDDLAIIRAVLNDYELVAIGVRVGILDEEMCLRYMRGLTLKDWHSASQIIKSLRRKYNNTALLAEFDALAQRWETKAVKRPPRVSFRWPPPRD